MPAHVSLTSLGAMLAFAPIHSLRPAKQTETRKSARRILSRCSARSFWSLDAVSGWTRTRSPRHDGIDERLRPPFTPWGQARFDAARPMQGPTAVPGQENAPTLHCDPDGPPRILILPNPFEIIQIPGRVLMFFELGHVWRTIWTDGRAASQRSRSHLAGILGGKVGRRHFRSRHDWLQR